MRYILAIFIIFCAVSLFAAEFTVYIPNDKIPDIKTAYKYEFNYLENVTVYNDTSEEYEVIPNPESVIDFIKRMIKKQIKDICHNYLRKIKKDEAISLAYEEALNETDTMFENVTVE